MELREKVEQHLEEILQNLATLVAYNSVQGEKSEEYPFGKVVADCLHSALTMADGYGFKTRNLENYCGYAEIGSGEKLIGILGHLDVVPAGEGWTSDPFTLTIRDGKAYGRGATDDKGAVICSMVAMKIIQEMNIPLNKRIRLIMGCNEETGSAGLKYYVEHEGHIDYGFTPDGNFPGVHGEKGTIAAGFISDNTKIIDLKGGMAFNAVASDVKIVIEKNSFSTRVLENFFHNHELTYTINEDDQTSTITVNGVSAHGSTPHLGVNAISYLLVGLKQAGFQDPFVDFYCQKIGLDTNGAGLNINVQDDYGDLTLNVGKIFMTEGKIVGTIDIRFPVSMTSKEILALMEENLEDEGGKIIIDLVREPLFFELDSPLVTKLLAAYQEVTHDYDSKPITMGGGTYAKGINNCIAFGCEFPGANCHIHDADEFVVVHELVLQTEIYVRAILKLLED